MGEKTSKQIQISVELDYIVFGLISLEIELMKGKGGFPIHPVHAIHARHGAKTSNEIIRTRSTSVILLKYIPDKSTEICFNY